MIKETDLELADGRTLHCYDSGEAGARLTVFWHHGSGAAENRAAAQGRAALEEYLAAHEFDMEQFTQADQAALTGDWAWLARIAGQAMKGDGEVGGGPDGYIEDQLASVSPWGFDPGQVTVPVLVFHGGQDRMVPDAHGAWLAARCPDAELWLRPDDGHVSVLRSCGAAALDWLVAHA